MTLDLAGTGASRAGRRAIEALVAGADDEARASAILVTSELVTNAIQAASSCIMSGWFLPDPGAIRIEVTDSSPDLPVMREWASPLVGGHGLRIVDQLATRWGVSINESSKTVWAEIDTTPPAPPRVH
jgi:anti-sigma regulatory factor (Ser/Thr protein kinase)